MESFPCATCGSTEHRFWRVRFSDREGRVEVCDKCENIKPSYPRDGLGQKVTLSPSFHKDYSYAIDAPIVSARQYANELKKQGLAQKEV